MPETILLDETGGVATLTLNQPARRNPMSARMGEELADALAELSGREEVRVLVVRGAGASFCAGGDLDLIETKIAQPAATRQREMLSFYDHYLALMRLPIPTIAQVHGHAVGGGLALALACDLCYAAEDARLGVNFARLGLHPGMGSTVTLPRAVGLSRALELFYTGRLVSGQEAEALGLVTRAVPAAELPATVADVAGRIARNAPLVVRMLKRAVRQNLEAAVSAAVDYEAFAQALTYGTDDLREGLAAVRERREPRFRGR